MDKKLLVELTAEIVSAHASVNEMGSEELLGEMQQVFQKLVALAERGRGSRRSPAGSQAAIPKQGVWRRQGLLLVCGKAFTTLKKHIAVSHQMTPKEYRKAFGIPSKTPLVARKYSEAKKKIAQEKGLAGKLAEGRRKRAAAKQ
jgi:predicted transcriptional regulator